MTESSTTGQAEQRRPILWTGIIFAALVIAVASIALYRLEEASRTIPNYVLIIQTAAVVLSLGSIVLLGLQLSAANRQAHSSVEQLTLTASLLTQTAKWNKMLSYHQFFGNESPRVP